MSELITAAEAIAEGLDHVAVVSNRPDALFDAYRRMGFRLTPWSAHSGAPRPGADAVAWGTGNRCAMFRTGYLELLAIVDETRHCGPFPQLVERYEGVHIIAYATSDAAAAVTRLRDRGIGVAGLVALQREVEIDGVGQTARFSLVRLEEGEAPEARFNFVQHLTPALLWREDCLDHPNGAVSLDEVIVAVADLEGAVARYRRLTGVDPVRAGRRRTFRFRHGAFSLVAADDLGAEMSGAQAPVLPFVAGFTVGTSDLAAATSHLSANGIDAIVERGRLIVPAASGCGATCIFEPAA